MVLPLTSAVVDGVQMSDASARAGLEHEDAAAAATRARTHLDRGARPMSPQIVPVPFRLGTDDHELHEMIYAFWTDVPGHTHRPPQRCRTR